MTEDERTAGELPPDAVVVRCGEMKVEDLERSAQRYFDLYGEREYALSFFSFAGQDVDYIARQARCPNPVVRTSRAGRLDQAGYELVRTGGRPGHYSIFWVSKPSREEWRLFRELFDAPVPNAAALL